MSRIEVRVAGDPFAATECAARMRAFVGAARASGLTVGLSLTGARGADAGPALVPLTGGASPRQVWSAVGGAQLDELLDAAREPIAATAPLVVFGEAEESFLAGLEHADACTVIDAGEIPVDDLVAAAVEFVAAWPQEECVARHDELAPFEALPLARGDEGVVLHCCGERSGALLVADAMQSTAGLRLRVLAPDAATRAALDGRAGVEFLDGALRPELLADVRAIVQPFAAPPRAAQLAVWLASGRPLVASRFGASALLLAPPGVCLPVAGRVRSEGFVPSARSLHHALARIATDTFDGREIAERARRHALEHCAGPRPMTPPVAARVRRDRPLVVLEAPLLETSSSSHLTIETARALLARDRVDVLLRPTVPFASDLAAFARRAPELVAKLARSTPRADLFVASGWPPRTARPDARAFALRIDWEWGALPTELTPAVTCEADHVIVHSSSVRRTVLDAGVPAERVAVIPHGVDAAVFHEDAEPLSRVAAWKRDRRAVLFVGGPIWRKGIDLLLKTLLENWSRRDPLCLVVKTVGAATSYRGFELSELLERVRASSHAVEVLILDDDLTPGEMAGVFRACDVLLHPYRGEGFGLPVLEARACGLPVVVTRGGSTDDFCDGAGALSVPSTRRMVALDAPHEGQPFVLEPDAEAIAPLLRAALEPEIAAAARSAAPHVRAAHTWEGAAACIEALAFKSHGVEPWRRTAGLKARVAACR